MIKCFISHSSKDKDSYIRFVSQKIRKEVRIIDEESFEAGLGNWEEIIKRLDETSLFVVFISNHSLESPWVQGEISTADTLVKSGVVDRIVPIIIDKNITIEDSRIPSWMKENINIQLITKPAIAARIINARLLELSWKYHPNLKERQRIFVGRNEIIKSFEERMDDFEQLSPTCIIVSGLPAIGRRTFIKHALVKSNIVKEAFQFPIIILSEMDGIDDFILKVVDLGFSDTIKIEQLSTITLSEKLEIAKQLSHDIIKQRERILIEDKGALVLPNGEIVDWFEDVVFDIKKHDSLAFCIISNLRPRPSINREKPFFFHIAVKEMEDYERNGLLSRYSKFKELDLTREESLFFSDILTGYPEQVLYAVDLISENGVFEAKKMSHQIQQFSSDKARVVIDRIKHDGQTIDFIALLSKFDFISYEVLFDIVDESIAGPILQKLFQQSICEKIGSLGNYIRVNETIKDYINRSRLKLPSELELSINKHVSNYIKNYSDENSDISDYIFSVQEEIKRGGEIPDEIILPSVFVKSIKSLYDEKRNYKDALELCDRVLKRKNSLHERTLQHLLFIKCQCLARLRDNRFFGDVKEIAEPERSFLHGFYYRLSGNYQKAEDSFKRALSDSHGKKRDPRILGELVLVYMQSDEYELAFDLAKENYLGRPRNPINANNYFACLIKKERTPDNRTKLEEIIASWKLDFSERSQEMCMSAESRLLAYYDENEKHAIEKIDEAIARFPDTTYPLLTKAELATHFKNIKTLQSAVDELNKKVNKNAQTYRTFIRYKAILLAMNGHLHEANDLVKRELNGLIESSKVRLLEKLALFCANSGK